MAPALNKLALFQDNDVSGHAHGRKSVRDEQGGPFLRELRESREHFVLGEGIQSRRRFVENQHLGLPHEGATESDLLPLTAREFDTLVEFLSQDRVIAVGKAVDELESTPGLGCALHPLAIVQTIQLSKADVFSHSEIVAHKVLKNHADVATQVTQVVLPQVSSVDEYRSLRRIVES